jgi:hypothetical protein
VIWRCEAWARGGEGAAAEGACEAGGGLGEHLSLCQSASEVCSRS